MRVLQPGVGELPSVVHAHGGISPVLCSRQGRQEHGRKDGNDGYDYEEFNQRKCAQFRPGMLMSYAQGGALDSTIAHNKLTRDSAYSTPYRVIGKYLLRHLAVFVLD